MPHVVRQCECFGEIDVEPERSRNGARYLRHFNGVGEAIAEMVGVTARENLRLVIKPAKGARVDHAVAVTLEVVAEGMRRLGIAASASVLDAHREISQHGGSVARGVLWICWMLPPRSFVVPRGG